MTTMTNPNSFDTRSTTGLNSAKRPSRSLRDIPLFVWREAAERLTEWAVRRLVVHYDVFGSQEPSVFIRRHNRRDYFNEGPVWLHPVSRKQTAKWFLITVDHHCDDPAQRAAVNWRTAIGWYKELQRRGFRPLLLDSNRGEDLQLLVLLSEEVPASRVLTFVQRFVSDYEARGLSQAPDFMPNQADIDSSLSGTKRWRLLGLDESGLNATRVWDGERWLEREPAIEAILATTGDPPELISDAEDSVGSTGQAVQ